MSDVRPPGPTHGVVATIVAGDVVTTTRCLSMTAVVFHAPVAFTPGTAFDFLIIVPGAMQLEMNCRGAVLTCEADRDGRFEVAATIDSFRIAKAAVPSASTAVTKEI